MQDSRFIGSVNTSKKKQKGKRDSRNAGNLHRLTAESDLLESVQILKLTSSRIRKEKKELRAAANLHRRRIASYQKELDELIKEEQFLSVSGLRDNHKERSEVTKKKKKRRHNVLDLEATIKVFRDRLPALKTACEEAQVALAKAQLKFQQLKDELAQYPAQLRRKPADVQAELDSLRASNKQISIQVEHKIAVSRRNEHERETNQGVLQLRAKTVGRRLTNAHEQERSLDSQWQRHVAKMETLTQRRTKLVDCIREFIAKNRSREERDWGWHKLRSLAFMWGEPDSGGAISLDKVGSALSHMLTSTESLSPGDLKRVVAECPPDPGAAEDAVPFLRFEQICNAFFSDAENDKENTNLDSNSTNLDSNAESTSISGKPDPHSSSRRNANHANGSSMDPGHGNTETSANSDVDATSNAAADTGEK